MKATEAVSAPVAYPNGRPPTSGATFGARRSVPHLLVGVFLVAVCALAFAVTSLRTDPRAAVLALARPVEAGHVLSDGDLVVTRVAADPTVAVVPASERGSVVGRTVTMPLPARGLLSPEVVGPAAWPPAGQSVIAVGVKPGRAPAGAVAGARVVVLVIPPASASAVQAPGAGPLQAEATVVAARSGEAAGTTVVSLLMTSSDAVRIAGASGEVALVVTGGPG